MSRVWVSLDEASTLRQKPYDVLMWVIVQALLDRRIKLCEEDRLWLIEAYAMFKGSTVFLPGFWDIEGDRYSGEGV